MSWANDSIQFAITIPRFKGSNTWMYISMTFIYPQLAVHYLAIAMSAKIFETNVTLWQTFSYYNIVHTNICIFSTTCIVIFGQRNISSRFPNLSCSIRVVSSFWNHTVFVSRYWEIEMKRVKYLIITILLKRFPTKTPALLNDQYWLLTSRQKSLQFSSNSKNTWSIYTTLCLKEFVLNLKRTLHNMNKVFKIFSMLV